MWDIRVFVVYILMTNSARYEGVDDAPNIWVDSRWVFNG